MKYEQPRERFSKDPYIKIRVVRYHYIVNKNNQTTTVDLMYFTNLSKDEFSSSDIVYLYNRRWDIENSYKILKSNQEWERYFSKECDSERSSIYAKVLFHNLSGIVQKEMDKELYENHPKKTKYGYKINRKQLNNLLRDEKILRWMRNENQKKIQKIMELISKIINKIKVPVRPGRHYKRWGRVISQSKPMRFRLDGREWPNTISWNGRLMTIKPR